eukprot:8974336-Alexandrium_andersonii.AAC.1
MRMSKNPRPTRTRAADATVDVDDVGASVHDEHDQLAEARHPGPMRSAVGRARGRTPRGRTHEA